MAEYEVELHAAWRRTDTWDDEVRAFRPKVRRALRVHAKAKNITIEVTQAPDLVTTTWGDMRRRGTYAGTISFTTDVEAKSQADAVEKAEALFKTALTTKRAVRKRPDESWTAYDRRIDQAPGMAWCRAPKVQVI